MAAGEWPADAEQAFLERMNAATVDPAGGGAPVALGLDGKFAGRLDHEPEKFRGNLPAVTLYAVQAPEEDLETGPAAQVVWEWRVNLYVNLQPGYEDAQAQLKELWPLVMRGVRLDPSLGLENTWATLSDPGLEPEISSEEKFIVKTLRLRVSRGEA